MPAHISTHRSAHMSARTRVRTGAVLVDESDARHKLKGVLNEVVVTDLVELKVRLSHPGMSAYELLTCV